MGTNKQNQMAKQNKMEAVQFCTFQHTHDLSMSYITAHYAFK